MARMYSRRRGKSGSKKPVKKSVPSWVPLKAKEVELLIAKLYKEGSSPSLIGLILRDTYGIPDVQVLCGKSITGILSDKKIKLEVPEDLSSLIKKFAAVKKHLENNRKDQSARRGLLITSSKIKKLVKYYKRTGKLDEKWKFDPEKAGFFLE
ncbi:30S ribosomal protein S15 [Candidatus Woesearchaeota archaeon]|nr:30S ribosomal protein S15 [Candidatus Woesearchaeota archaeon]MBI2661283.1 30S ribosomal protein S15 [Candidatus Woesearchaeota archaeon]